MAYSAVQHGSTDSGTSKQQKCRASDGGRLACPQWQCRLVTLLRNCDLMLQLKASAAVERRSSVCLLQISVPVQASLCYCAI